MKDKILAMICIFSIYCSVAEAITYTNEEYGFAIDLPSNFTYYDSTIFDLQADGGDDYGENNLLQHKEGISVTIMSKPSEYDIFTRNHMFEKVKGYREAAKKFGMDPADFFVVNVSPNHEALGSSRVDIIDNFTRVGMNIEAIMHKRNINVSVTGTRNNVKEMKKIIESFRCTIH